MRHELKRKGMQSVRPLRTEEEKERCLDVARKHDIESGSKNMSWELFLLIGWNVGLRISDLVRLKVKDVRAPKGWVLRQTAKKTGKELGHGEGQYIPDRIHGDIMRLTEGRDPEDWLFRSRQIDRYTEEARPISRQRAWEIVNAVASGADIPGHIGCHTLRKTFGYDFYQQFQNISFLQDIFGHSSEAVTKRYIGVSQSEINSMLKRKK